jgi:hypothetical protein
MTDFVILIGIVVFLGLLVALAGPIRSYFSTESKLFLHDLKANDEIDLEGEQREATAVEKPRVKPN